MPGSAGGVQRFETIGRRSVISVTTLLKCMALLQLRGDASSVTKASPFPVGRLFPGAMSSKTARIRARRSPIMAVTHPPPVIKRGGKSWRRTARALGCDSDGDPRLIVQAMVRDLAARWRVADEEEAPAPPTRPRSERADGPQPPLRPHRRRLDPIDPAGSMTICPQAPFGEPDHDRR